MKAPRARIGGANQPIPTTEAFMDQERDLPPVLAITGMHNEGHTLIISYRADDLSQAAAASPATPGRTPPSATYRLKIPFPQMAVACQNFARMLQQLEKPKPR